MEYEEARYREIQSVIENVPVGICVYRSFGGTTLCVASNSACADMLGREDLTGKTPEDMVQMTHPDDRERCRQEAIALLRKNGRSSGTYRMYHAKRQRYQWLRLDGRIVPQPDGTHYTYVTYTDIHELKENELRLQAEYE